MGALREGPVQDVTEEHITLRVDGASVPAFHARPDGMPQTGVVLHPDIAGSRPLFFDMARRLATHCFAVICTEPFSRVLVDQRSSLEARMGAVPDLDDAQQLADLEAAADRL